MDHSPALDSTVVLRDDDDARGTRYLDATIDAKGRLVIEGQDLGAVVETVFGEGYREHEWRWTVEPGELAAAVAALGGGPGDPPLAIVARWTAERGTDPGSAIKAAGVRIGFWRRLGD